MPGIFDISADSLPRILPVMPQENIILLPGARLPLEVSELRYINLVLDALGRGRLFGLVQPRRAPLASPEDPPLYGVGCIARVSSFRETQKNTLLISMAGVCRFRITRELSMMRGYRQAEIDTASFQEDLADSPDSKINRPQLESALKTYIQAENLAFRHDLAEKLPDSRLLSFLSMALPFTDSEKQALLEAPTAKRRADILHTLLTMNAGTSVPREGMDEN